jgi:hypothetical protein
VSWFLGKKQSGGDSPWKRYGHRGEGGLDSRPRPFISVLERGGQNGPGRRLDDGSVRALPQRPMERWHESWDEI